jgi:hypothetical protein
VECLNGIKEGFWESRSGKEFLTPNQNGFPKRRGKMLLIEFLMFLVNQDQTKTPLFRLILISFILKNQVLYHKIKNLSRGLAVTL